MRVLVIYLVLIACCAANAVKFGLGMATNVALRGSTSRSTIDKEKITTKQLLTKLIEGQDLTASETESLWTDILVRGNGHTLSILFTANLSIIFLLYALID